MADSLTRSHYCLCCGQTFDAYHRVEISAVLMRCERCRRNVRVILGPEWFTLTDAERSAIGALIDRSSDREMVQPAVWAVGE